MSKELPYTVIDGIKCFSLEVASSYTDYPDEGFDLTDKTEEGSFWVSSRNRLFKSIIKRYQSQTGKTNFLEIGCGNGGFIRQIVDNHNLEITGSEIYLKGLHYAKKSLADVNFIQFDVTKGCIGELFDMIVAFDVLEHIENDVEAISNINQMLAKNGIMVLSVPQHMFLWGKLDEIVKHKRRYSRKELLKKLETNGFEISYCTSFLFLLFPLMLVSRAFDKGASTSNSVEKELEKRVKFSILMNIVFDQLMKIDELLIKWGFSLPYGGTLVIVAKKSSI